MVNSRQKVMFALIVMIVLAILGLLFSEIFFAFVLTQFDDLDVQFQSTELLGGFKSTYMLALSLAVLPILFLLSNYLLRTEKSWKILSTIPITILCGIACMFFHINSIRGEIVSFPLLAPEISNYYPVSSIHAALYLGFGFILGATLATALFYLTSKKRRS